MRDAEGALFHDMSHPLMQVTGNFPIEGIESLLLEEFKQQLLSDARGPRLASVDTLSLRTDMDPCFTSLNTGFPKALRALTS